MENIKKYTTMSEDEEESFSDIFATSDVEKSRTNRANKTKEVNKRTKTQSITSSKKSKLEKPQTSYLNKIEQLIQGEEISSGSENTLTVRQENHNVIFKYPMNNSEDYWVIQHYRMKDIENIPSSDRWKHASCSVKMYTDQENTKDRNISNVFHKLVEMISERFVNDPDKTITKHKLDAK